MTGGFAVAVLAAAGVVAAVFGGLLFAATFSLAFAFLFFFLGLAVEGAGTSLVPSNVIRSPLESAFNCFVTRLIPPSSLSIESS